MKKSVSKALAKRIRNTLGFYGGTETSLYIVGGRDQIYLYIHVCTYIIGGKDEIRITTVPGQRRCGNRWVDGSGGSDARTDLLRRKR